jgi:hypothetical protein
MLAIASMLACSDGAQRAEPARRDVALLYALLPTLMWDVLEGPTDGTWCLDPRIASDVPIQFFTPDAPRWSREVIDTLMRYGRPAILAPYARPGEPACTPTRERITASFGAPRAYGDTVYAFLAFERTLQDSAGYYFRWENRFVRRNGTWKRLSHPRTDNVPEIDLSPEAESILWGSPASRGRPVPR